jgi:hypothetical protein
MRKVLCTLLSLAAIFAVGSARADHSLALPKLVSAQPAMMPLSVLGVGFFTPSAILDLRTVQNDPIMRARRDYSLMAALPATERISTMALPPIETQTWRASKSVMFTFPLAITGKNLATAEITGAGQVGVAPHGMAKGAVLTFTGEF